MRTIRKCIIVLLILVIVLVLLLLLNKKNNNSNTHSSITGNYEQLGETGVTRELSLNKDDNILSLYTMESFIREYVSYANQGDIEQIEKLSYKDNLDYNLINYSSNNYYIQEAYISQTTDNGIYYTYGICVNNLGNIEDKYYTINIDYNNYTFAIADSSKKEYEAAAVNKEAKQVSKFSINKNEINKYMEKSLDFNERVQIYLDDFYFKLNYDPEIAFNLLDEEYRVNKFGDVSGFIEYVNKNKEQIINFKVDEVGYNYVDEHLQYKCTSTTNLVYIIDTYGGLDYRIKLDNYTTENNNLHANLKDEEKITLIIDKILEILNNKDYAKLYEMTNREFKKNNFPTEESFEEYFKEYFFETNILSRLSIEKNSGMYICTCVIRDSDKLTADKITREFIILLNEGTNFEMSFKIKK